MPESNLICSKCKRKVLLVFTDNGECWACFKRRAAETHQPVSITGSLSPDCGYVTGTDSQLIVGDTIVIGEEAPDAR